MQPPVYHRGMATYGDPRRYLMKALREIAHQIEEVVAGADDRTLRRRPDDGPDGCSMLDLLAYLRDAERDDLRALRGVVARDGAPLGERCGDFGPAQREDERERPEELLWDFAMLREETLWTLRTAGDGWEHAGQHRYRGSLPVLDLVREVNQRDLDTLWRMQRLHERFSAPGRALR